MNREIESEIESRAAAKGVSLAPPLSMSLAPPRRALGDPEARRHTLTLP